MNASFGARRSRITESAKPLVIAMIVVNAWYGRVCVDILRRDEDIALSFSMCEGQELIELLV